MDPQQIYSNDLIFVYNVHVQPFLLLCNSHPTIVTAVTVSDTNMGEGSGGTLNL